MKCPNCNGRGFDLFRDRFGIVGKLCCVICNGTGEVKESTKKFNEERFCSLSTEEKAKALHKLYWEIQNHIDYSPDEDDYVEEYCLYWLKKVAE